MKRGMAILPSLCALATVAYFTASKWAIHHKTLTLYDPLRTGTGGTFCARATLGLTIGIAARFEDHDQV